MEKFKVDFILCKTDDFSFEKLYCLVDDIKTRTDMYLTDLSGKGGNIREGGELNCTFTKCEKSIYIKFNKIYEQEITISLTMTGSIDIFNEYYKKLKDIKEKNFPTKEDDFLSKLG